MYATFSVDDGLLLSALAVAGGILGYRFVGAPRNVFWQGQRWSMLPLGIVMMVHPLVD